MTRPCYDPRAPMSKKGIHQNGKHSAPARARKRIVIAFAVLGLVVPIALYPIVAYEGPLQQGSRGLAPALGPIVPYLWPSAPVVAASAGGMRDVAVSWAISLGLNALVYSGVGWIVWRVARFVAWLRMRSQAS
jgi:hypothetical protein